MGMYTSIAFKAIVKPEFRSLTDLFLKGKWRDSDDTHFSEYGKDFRSGFIPCGAGCGGFYDEQITDVDEGMPYYNESTGEWEVFCSCKNYDLTIEKFLTLMPYFIEKCDLIQYHYETDDCDDYYSLINGKVVKIDKPDE